MLLVVKVLHQVLQRQVLLELLQLAEVVVPHMQQIMVQQVDQVEEAVNVLHHLQVKQEIHLQQVHLKEIQEEMVIFFTEEVVVEQQL